jgi:hypothetical protein
VTQLRKQRFVRQLVANYEKRHTDSGAAKKAEVRETACNKLREKAYGRWRS